MHTVCFNNITGINGVLYCDDNEACCGVANDQWCCQGHVHSDNTWYIIILTAVSGVASLALLVVSVSLLKILKTRQIHRTERIIGLSRRLTYEDTPSQASQTDPNGGLSSMAATYPHIGGRFESSLPQGQRRENNTVRPSTGHVTPVQNVIYRPGQDQTVGTKSPASDYPVSNNWIHFSAENSHRKEKENIVLPVSTCINYIPDRIISLSDSDYISKEVSKRNHNETNGGETLSADTHKISSLNACKKIGAKVSPPDTLEIKQEKMIAEHSHKEIEADISPPEALEKQYHEITSSCDPIATDGDILPSDVQDTVCGEVQPPDTHEPIYGKISSPDANAINEKELSSCYAQQTIAGKIATSDSHKIKDEDISTPATSEIITDEMLSPYAQATIADEILQPVPQESPDETIASVAQKTKVVETMSPVAQERIAYDISSPATDR